MNTCTNCKTVLPDMAVQCPICEEPVKQAPEQMAGTPPGGADPLPRCPYCQAEIESGVATSECATCQAVHHSECFSENGGCSMPSCPGSPGFGAPPLGSAIPPSAQQQPSLPAPFAPGSPPPMGGLPLAGGSPLGGRSGAANSSYLLVVGVVALIVGGVLGGVMGAAGGSTTVTNSETMTQTDTYSETTTCTYDAYYNSC